jgi:hypothetical protein
MVSLNYLFAHFHSPSVTLVELKMRHELFTAHLRPEKFTMINIAKVERGQNHRESAKLHRNVNFFGFPHNGQNAHQNVGKAYRVE